MYENDDRISELRNKGLSYGEIAKELNLSRDSVASVCKRLKRGSARKNKFDSIKTMRESGKTYKEIADTLGVRKDGIADYCQKHGLAYSDEELLVSRSHSKGCLLTDWNRKIEVKYGGTFKLVSIGEPDNKSERCLVVECLNCGTQKSVSSNSLKGEGGKYGYCEKCKANKRETTHSEEYYERQRVRQKARAVERQIKNQQDKLIRERRKAKHKLKTNQVGLKLCSCGLAFITQNRSSCDECKRKKLREIENRKNTKRRIKAKELRFDTDITLRKLYKRDNGICYLCGRTCDWNDYKTINGSKVVGGSYPTIEHVIALCNGGSHTWDNIKLACHLCNSKKGRKLLAS